MSQWEFENFTSTLVKFTSSLHLSHSNDFFSETTAPMVIKFHMQHNKAAGLQNDEIQASRESKWLLLLKIARTTWLGWNFV